jgi:GT2 family glycosyltransferase
VDPEHFAIFFDDDVRVHAQTLLAYSDAIHDRLHSAFFGGQCLVDYDEPPQTWLIPYLPASAKGWSLGQSVIEFNQPHALGFNWCARVGDLRRCGGFDVDRGPGTFVSIGDESSVQERLMNAGVTGYYVPRAIVSHYVPSERCNERWALQRAMQNGFVRGLSCGSHGANPRVNYRYRMKHFRSTFMLLIAGQFLTREKRFHYEYWKMRHSGMLAGLRIAASRLPSRNAHAA